MLWLPRILQYKKEGLSSQIRKVCYNRESFCQAKAIKQMGIDKMIIDIFMDAVLDSVRLLPFLIAAFLFMEWLERYSGDYINRVLAGVGHAGPIVGAFLGCIPQCGFSVVAANLFSGGIITPGTLMAVFLATSDEAILILMGNPGRGKEILWLLFTKIIIAIVAGYLIDLLIHKRHNRAEDMERICEDCGCHDHGTEHGSIWKAALHHTLQIFLYLLLFTVLLNLAIELLGVERISTFLLGDSVFQPLIAGLIGMIPNCAASIMLTELYLSGAISFASVVAGLCTGAGLGLVVLFRMNQDKKENFKLVGILYGVAVIAGILIEIVSLHI